MNIDFLRKYCNSFPGVEEDIKWGNDLCFLVGGKMFCVTSLEGPFSATFKVRDEEFDELTGSGNFEPAPYLARAKWVLATTTTRLNKEEWQSYLHQSYLLVAKKLSLKTQKALGLTD